MKNSLKFPSTGLILSAVFFLNSTCNNKPPFTPDYKNVKGYVVGKETCNTDSTQDYWLIDLTYLANTPQYGDTVVLNNVTYANVVKTKGLSAQLKNSGMPVSIDFKVISNDRVLTSACTIINPITYPLKELFIINQFEIR